MDGTAPGLILFPLLFFAYLTVFPVPRSEENGQHCTLIFKTTQRNNINTILHPICYLIFCYNHKECRFSCPFMIDIISDLHQVVGGFPDIIFSAKLNFNKSPRTICKLKHGIRLAFFGITVLINTGSDRISIYSEIMYYQRFLDSSGIRSITVLAYLFAVVDFPHHLGPTITRAPLLLSVNSTVLSNNLLIYSFSLISAPVPCLLKHFTSNRKKIQLSIGRL